MHRAAVSRVELYRQGKASGDHAGAESGARPGHRIDADDDPELRAGWDSFDQVQHEHSGRGANGPDARTRRRDLQHVAACGGASGDSADDAGHVDADKFWERITYFLDRVIPVANEYKIRMACHPHDPGVPPEGYQGVDRVLGTVDGLKKFITIQESPYHGLNFCQGTVSEMLADPGKEIYDVIRYFGTRKKIFNVHFRNIRGHRDDFVEVYPDEGDVDFVKAIQVYKEVGYPYMLMPDHVPLAANDPDGLQSFAFCYGYIRGLMQSLEG